MSQNGQNADGHHNDHVADGHYNDYVDRNLVWMGGTARSMGQGHLLNYTQCGTIDPVMSPWDTEPNLITFLYRVPYIQIPIRRNVALYINTFLPLAK